MHNLKYNIYQYCQDTLGLTFAMTIEGFMKESPNDCITFLQSGGPIFGDIVTLESVGVQFLCRGVDKNTVSSEIYKIFENLKSRYHVVFPSYNDGNIITQDIFVNQISATQTPSYLGMDENGLHLYSVNFTIYLKGA